MAQLFISHARSDEDERKETLIKKIRDELDVECWMDEENIRAE
jgi:hypothetical protein